jgi:transposase
MARAYGDDLRRKVLVAYAAGQGTQEQLAARFDVSFGWVKKIRRAELSTGSRSGTPQRRRRSQVDGKLLRELVRQKPDIVLRELEEAMREHGHAVSKSQLWRVLKKLGLRLKKVAPRHRARHQREPSQTRSVRRNHPHGRTPGPDLSGRKAASRRR